MSEIAIKLELNYNEFFRWENLQNGVLWLEDEIDTNVSSRFIDELNYAIDKGNKEIFLYMNSSGGFAYDAFAIYDAILSARKRRIKVNIIVFGWAASAASMIVLQAATVRKANKHARFMIHEIRRWKEGDETKSAVEDDAKEMKNVHEVMVKVLVERTKKTPEEIKQTIERIETYFSAEEAKKFGLIDIII